MITVHIDKECAAPVDHAFRYVADYRHTVRYLYGLSKFEPVTELDRGLGATFDGKLRLGPVAMSSRMKIVDWAEPAVLRWKSIRGVDTCFTFRFSALEQRRSRVELSIETNLFGLAGSAMAKAIAPLVDSAAEQTGTKLAEQIAAYYTAQQNA
ncbi:SRPBCC family protein [Nocardia sp. NPDC046473]|uniref:SRPBCC family protein n=1 Tax=Nocardia sp. NPDC046473 TaxID=3155733 RepID=UPI0033CFA9D5